MVRIRKKTSNRTTTAQRAKVKHKTRESKKKAKKEAKKNPHLHKKKKKKDPGIPNSFPFKEQILTEVAAARRQALEEKQRKNELKQKNPEDALLQNTSQPIKLISGTDQNEGYGQNTMEIDDEAPPLIDTTIPDTAAAIQAADVVIQVLDARDPLSYRSSFIDNVVGDKPLFIILNKIDLAPRESVKSWASFFRKNNPTLLFRSASRQLPADALSMKDGKKAQPKDDDACGLDALMKALKVIKSEKHDLTVTLVGVTNVGKSAIINSILKKSTLPVYSPLLKHSQNSPSTTPYPRSVTIAYKKRSYRFVDTPGLSFIPPSEPRTDDEIETQIARDVLLRNRGNISKINDPLPAALYILSRAVIEDVMMLYNLPAVQADDYHAVLTSLARKEGALQKRGAVVDFQGAARALVRDWKSGRLAFYSMPSSEELSETTATSKASDSRLERIYEETDDQIVSQILPRKEIRRSKGAIIQLKGARIDPRRVDLEANVMLSDESDEEDIGAPNFQSRNGLGNGDDSEEEESDTNGEEDDDEDENEDGDDEDKIQVDDISLDEPDSDLDEELDDGNSPVEPSPPPKLSRKQQRATNRAEGDDGKSKAADSKKKVSFVPYTKAGAKVKKQAVIPQPQLKSKPKSKLEPPQKARPASLKDSKAGTAMTTKKFTDQEDGGAYDFSRYF